MTEPNLLLLNTGVNQDRDIEVEALFTLLTEVVSASITAAGITRKELARRMGVSPAHVSQMLSGERNMTLRTIAEALHAMNLRLSARAIPFNDPDGDVVTSRDLVTLTRYMADMEYPAAVIADAVEKPWNWMVEMGAAERWSRTRSDRLGVSGA